MTESFQPKESGLPDSVGPATLPELEAMAEAKKLYLQKVTWIHHWTHGLFSFRVERPRSLRFRSGEFLMIGLKDGERPLLRDIFRPTGLDITHLGQPPYRVLQRHAKIPEIEIQFVS